MQTESVLQWSLHMLQFIVAQKMEKKKQTPKQYYGSRFFKAITCQWNGLIWETNKNHTNERLAHCQQNRTISKSVKHGVVYSQHDCHVCWNEKQVITVEYILTVFRKRLSWKRLFVTKLQSLGQFEDKIQISNEERKRRPPHSRCQQIATKTDFLNFFFLVKLHKNG